MPQISRRQSPGVKNGRVQKKNNWEVSPDYYSHPQRELVIDRQRPGAGYRHVLMQRDVERFIEMLPDWDEMSRGLDAIVLAPGREGYWGWHSPGVVHVCAWDEDWERFFWPSYFEVDRASLERIGVPLARVEEGVWAYFTPDTARAFLLTDVLLHELGHHHDAMTTRSARVARGEPYANAYQRKYGDLVWQRFLKCFPLD